MHVLDRSAGQTRRIGHGCVTSGAVTSQRVTACCIVGFLPSCPTAGDRTNPVDPIPDYLAPQMVQIACIQDSTEESTTVKPAYYGSSRSVPPRLLSNRANLYKHLMDKDLNRNTPGRESTGSTETATALGENNTHLISLHPGGTTQTATRPPCRR